MYITIGSLRIFSSAIIFSLCFLCVAMTSRCVPAPIRNLPTILGKDLSVSMLGGGFKHVLFSPRFGEDSHCDDHIFQMAWFNHHLAHKNHQHHNLSGWRLCPTHCATCGVWQRDHLGSLVVFFNGKGFEWAKQHHGWTLRLNFSTGSCEVWRWGSCEVLCIWVAKKRLGPANLLNGGKMAGWT